jgi:hypothetical protein
MAQIVQASSKITVTTTAPLTIKLESSSGKPVSDAKVTLDNVTSQTTDREGQTTFQDIRLGSHFITVSSHGKVLLANKQLTLISKSRPIDIKLSGSKVSFYYELAGVVAIFIIVSYFYRNRLHKMHQTLSPVAPEPLTNNHSMYSSEQLANNMLAGPTVQQPGQMASPGERRQ